MEEILKGENPVLDLTDLDGSVLSEDLLKAIADSGKDVEVKLDSGYSYIINADSVDKEAVKAFDLDISVDLVGKAAVLDSFDGVKVPGNSIVIAPNFAGEFGFEVTFTFTAEQLKESGVNGNNISLFYVDDNGKVTDMGKVKLNADGSVEITVSHASYYVLSEESPIDAGDNRYSKGDVLGTGKVTINDALEILRYLAKLESEVESKTLAWNAAVIVSDEKPTINDALEILRYLAKLTSKLD